LTKLLPAPQNAQLDAAEQGYSWQKAIMEQLWTEFTGRRLEHKNVAWH
jgi:hypothetical protein